MRHLLVIAVSVLLVHQKEATAQSEIEYNAKKYKQEKKVKYLEKVVVLLPADVDTSYVKALLGEPIDMDFDYRYTTDERGKNGCIIGAVFHYNTNGKIEEKWVGEICE
ncbi:MAG: hypothetical protein AAF734_10080 [Bacteroidota bacterium]